MRGRPCVPQCVANAKRITDDALTLAVLYPGISPHFRRPGCDKAFSKSSNLGVHRRSHTGERPYPCPWDGCTWAFTTSGHLRTHLRPFEGNTPILFSRSFLVPFMPTKNLCAPIAFFPTTPRRPARRHAHRRAAVPLLVARVRQGLHELERPQVPLALAHGRAAAQVSVAGLPQGTFPTFCRA